MVGHNKSELLGVGFDTSVCARKVCLFCVNIMSDSLQCVFVLLRIVSIFSVMVLVTVARQ